MRAARTHSRGRGLAAAIALVAVLAAACSDDNSGDTGSDGTSASTPATEAPQPTSGDSTAPPDTGGDTSVPSGEDAGDGFAARGPATGEPILLGMVNTEGTPGLDFPEMRTDLDAAVEYLNAHGGFGGRPVQVEHCAAVGSPESSQACAQELAGKDVDLVMLGLDLFPGYDTFAASGIPVVGALPILPGDYTADARFLTGGNLTTMAAMVALAVEHYDAQTAGIISADNPGANGSEAALIAALEKAGVEYVSIKGGDNETDAGFQGLMRQAAAGNPDVLFSLDSDAGCIGAIRAGVSLAMTVPAISAPLGAIGGLIHFAGDDAVGWTFAGVGSTSHTPSAAEFEEIVTAARGDAGVTSIGVGALAITELMTLARAANMVAEAGGEVTGQSVYDALAGEGLRTFPNDTAITCGLVPAYPSVCSFEFPIGEYIAGGEVRTVPGFESISVVPYLP